MKKKKKKRIIRKRTRAKFDFGFGWDNWFDADGLVRDGSAKLKEEKSMTFQFGFHSKTRLGNENSKFYVKSGLDLVWNYYRFTGENNFTLDDDGSTIISPSTGLVDQVSKSYFRQFHTQIPVMLQFDASRFNMDKSFKLGVGAYGGYTFYNSHSVKGEDVKGDDIEFKTKNNYNVNRWHWGLQGEVGYGVCSVVVKYRMNELFKNNKGPELYPVSASLIFSL